MNFWTVEREEQLRQLWGEGHSVAEVARRMNAPTRNVVMGKLNRLHLLKSHGPETRKQSKSARKKPTGVTVSAGIFYPMRSEPLPPVHVPEPIIAVEPVFPKIEGLPRAMLERAEDQCCFPIGEPKNPDFHYCTGRKRDGGSYCAAHSIAARDGHAKRFDKIAGEPLARVFG